MADLLLDVFTHEGAGGNPLAVRILDEPLESGEMMAEAAAPDSRETAFLLPPAAVGGPCRVEVFTARRQIPFSGHAALGAARAAREHLLPGEPEEVVLAMALGDVDVRFESGTAWLTAPTIELGSSWPAPEVRATLGLRGPAGALDLPRLTGAGLPILIVPVAGLEELHACHLDAAAFRAFGVRMVRHRALHTRVYAFCRETRSEENHLSARLLLPGDEESLEDPASGAAAACLGACLSVQGGLDPAGGELRIEQGFEMGRPSLLRLRTASHGGIEVGGAVRPAPAASP